jgi:hypothetical protein
MDRELEVVDVGGDVLDEEDVVPPLAAGGLERDVDREAISREEDVGETVVGELGETGLLLEVESEEASRKGVSEYV